MDPNKLPPPSVVLLNLRSASLGAEARNKSLQSMHSIS